jgi:hypothetical protein
MGVLQLMKTNDPGLQVVLRELAQITSPINGGDGWDLHLFVGMKEV